MRNAVVFVAYFVLSIFQPSLAGLPKDDEDAAFWMKKAQMELTNALTLTTNENVAKNVVLFLGDGMGISTGTAARILKGQLNGMPGEETVLAMETFPHVALSKTYGTDIQTQDSAGSGTAFLSGVKTRVGVIGLDTKAISANCSSQKGREVTSILDWALEAGKSVGIVTTTRVTHATPAAAYAHASMRYWELDADMVNVTGGCKDITLQLIEDNPNIQEALPSRSLFKQRRLRSNNVGCLLRVCLPSPTRAVFNCICVL